MNKHVHMHRLHFVYWMITMTAITVSLVLAASEPDPQNYNHPLDSFRVVCEAVAVFMVILASIKELYHIYVYVVCCTLYSWSPRMIVEV